MDRAIDPHEAVDYLLRNAKKFSEAKAQRIYLEEFRKSKLALLMKQSMEKTLAGQERDALAHVEYQELLQGIKQAVEIEEELRWHMVAAQARVEIWRSQEATARNEIRITQ
jgi:hypothetical protein